MQDLLFGGVAGQVDNNDFVYGLQADASFALSDSHTLRAGLLATYDTRSSTPTPRCSRSIRPGSKRPTSRFDIVDDSGNHGTGIGLYLQDEWRLTDRLTLNYGARYDLFDASFDRESQLSPRVNLVWQDRRRDISHAGFSRYFMPPTLQYIQPATIESSWAPPTPRSTGSDDPQKVERDNYFDAGHLPADHPGLAGHGRLLPQAGQKPAR